MTAALTTPLPALIGGTPVSGNTLALSGSEQEWAFTTAVRTVVAQFSCSGAFLIASQTGGSYFRVGADIGYTIPIGPVQSVFVKAVTGTPDLTVAVVG